MRAGARAERAREGREEGPQDSGRKEARRRRRRPSRPATAVKTVAALHEEDKEELNAKPINALYVYTSNSVRISPEFEMVEV